MIHQEHTTMTESLARTDTNTQVSVFDGVLADREFKFVIAFCGVANFNATKAAEIAGYPKRSAHIRGHEVKKRNDVRARIRSYLEDQGLDDAEWLHHITDVARRPLDEFVTIIATDKEGNPIAAKMDASAKMKALELYGKARGLFVDKIDVNVEHVVREYIGIDPDTFDDAIDAESVTVGDEE